MDSVALGALAAVIASALFSAGLVLQSLEARTAADDESLSFALILHLARRPRWLLGGLVMLVGFGFHITALIAAPLTVVQPALAAGLLFLLAIGLRTHAEPIGAREVAGVVGIVAGVAGLTFAAPGRSTGEAEAVSVALALGTLAVAALIPHVLALARSRRGYPGSLFATFGAGAGYALTGLTTKYLSDRVAMDDWLGALGWLVFTAVAALLALVDQNSALQRHGAIEVGPIVFVVPVVVPVVLAPALVGEGWSEAPLSGVPMLVALAAVCAGAVALSRSAPVAAAGGPAPHGGAPGAREPSAA